MATKIRERPVLKAGVHHNFSPSGWHPPPLPEEFVPMKSRTYLDKYTGVLRYQHNGHIISKEDTIDMTPEVQRKHEMARKLDKESETLHDFKARVELSIQLVGLVKPDHVTAFLTYGCNRHSTVMNDCGQTHLQVYIFGRFAVVAPQDGGDLRFAEVRESMYCFDPAVPTDSYRSVRDFATFIRYMFKSFGLEFNKDDHSKIQPALQFGAEQCVTHKNNDTRYRFGKYEIHYNATNFYALAHGDYVVPRVKL